MSSLKACGTWERTADSGREWVRPTWRGEGTPGGGCGGMGARSGRGNL